MRQILIAAVRLYQRFVSPLKRPCCRFEPTCSDYAAEAVRVHGAFKGAAMALWRFLRCNPFCKGGFDPVKNPSAKGNKEKKH